MINQGRVMSNRGRSLLSKKLEGGEKTKERGLRSQPDALFFDRGVGLLAFPVLFPRAFFLGTILACMALV